MFALNFHSFNNKKQTRWKVNVQLIDNLNDDA